MPTPLQPVELAALIEQNITDELDQQNTAQRVREVLLYMVASMGLPATPGTPGNPDYAALMAELAKKADKNAVTTALSQKEPSFKPFTQTELTTIEYAYSNLALRPLLRELIRAVASGVGGGSGGVAVAAETYTVSLSGGKTSGTIKNGDIVTKGTRYDDAWWRRVLIEDIFPTYTPASASLSQSAPQDGEVGESVANTLTLTFNRGDAGALTADQINKDGVRISTAGTTSPFQRNSNVVRTLTPIVYQGLVSYAAGTAKPITPGNTPDTRPAQVRNPNTPQAAEANLASNTVQVNGYYRTFYGATSTTPVNSATTRNLSQSQLTNAGSQGILNTGTTATQFAIAVPPGYRLLSVFDLDNQGANITSAYAAQDTIQVNDAGGTPHDYFLYLYRAAGPYPVSARHQFTYGT